MMKRAPFTPCKLYVDGIPRLRCGHYIRSNGGSVYLVQTMRQNRNRPQRRHLDCVRWPPDQIPRGAVVHEIRWYPRGKKA
jgi:hypothetical protein